MIHFQLRCRPSGHAFDGWFRSNDDFERQVGSGFVECPVCGAGAVEKALMRPAIAKGGIAKAGASAKDGAERATAEARADGASPAGRSIAGGAAGPVESSASSGQSMPRTALANLPPPGPEVARALAVLQEISRKVRAEADYVGDTFAEEARRIHYGESEARQIYGEASKKDVEGLQEEGITAVPLMPLPEDGQ